MFNPDDSQQSNASAAALRDRAHSAWCLDDPEAKCRAVALLLDSANAELSRPDGFEKVPALTMAQTAAVELDRLEPGRPEAPVLVHPANVSRRQTGRAGGRGAMLHAIAHIEFNAINLALDAIWRYPHMPKRYAHDWASVAMDEARHFQMLCDELTVEGLRYGAYEAHDGLWAMARRTAHDLTARMALVPRVLEARGLDATPVIQRKLQAIGDTSGVALLQVLLEEEIRHVRVGDYWFRELCAAANKPAEQRYREIIASFEAPMPKPPLNRPARIDAGFTETELDWLDSSAATSKRSG